MEIGAHLPLIDFGKTDLSLRGLKSYARTASESGYKWLTANDHLVFGRPWLDGPSALTAVIQESGSMNLATTVSVPVLRGPVATAKILGAIDHLSGGRLTVAVGPGSSPRDYALIGVPFEERWKRLDESILTMKAAWDKQGNGYSGNFYTTSGEVLQPFPVQQPGPPVWIGSWGSEAGLRRVLRLGDGWLASGYNTNPSRFSEGLNQLGERLSAAGRDPSSFPNGIATMWTYVTKDAAKAESLLSDLLAPMLRREASELRQLLPIGHPEHCAGVFSSYLAVGAERIFIWPISDELDQLSIFSDEVMPLIQCGN